MQRTKDRAASKNLGAMVKAICKSRGELSPSVRKALNVSTGSNGGYLVPTEMAYNIDAILNEVGVFHQHCQVFDMTSTSMLVPGVNLSKTVSGSTPIFGGMNFGWKSEGGFGNIAADPSFQQIEFDAADTLGGILTVSNQLMEDGGEKFGEYLERLISEALLWFVEKQCWSGTGIGGAPLGVIYGPATVNVTRSGANAIALQDVSNLIEALLPGCFERAIWGLTPTGISNVMADAGFQIAPGSNPREGLFGYLMGRPLYVTEKLPGLGAVGDIVVFDPMFYGIGKRQLEIASSGHSKFSSNQTDIRVIWRGDCNPLAIKTATEADATTTGGVAAVLAA